MPGALGCRGWAATPKDRSFDDTDSLGGAVTNSFSGKSRMWIADGVWKWAPNGNSTVRNFKLQGEYFKRREDGTLASNSAAGACAGDCIDSYDSNQEWLV